GSRRTRHVRELPDHGVPGPPVPRSRVLQRVPGGRGRVRQVPGPAAERGRRPPAPTHRDRPGQPRERGGRAGPVDRVAASLRLRLDYPDVEVVVVDDGSTDDTRAIAHGFGVRVISTENRGLSAARNSGLEAATGEIVAYIDDDAYPDPHWLQYIAAAFLSSDH